MEPSITEINREKRKVNEAKAKAERDAMFASSPVGQFQQRMKNPMERGAVSVANPRESDVMGFQRELVGGEGMRNENVDLTPTTSGSFIDARGNQMGPKAQHFMSQGPTVLDNSRAGRTTIMGDQAMAR